MYILMATHPSGSRSVGYGPTLSTARHDAQRTMVLLHGLESNRMVYERFPSQEAVCAALAGLEPPRVREAGHASLLALGGESRLLTPKQTAERLGVSAQTVQNWSKQGKLTKLTGESTTARGKTQTVTFFLEEQVLERGRPVKSETDPVVVTDGDPAPSV